MTHAIRELPRPGRSLLAALAVVTWTVFGAQAEVTAQQRAAAEPLNVPSLAPMVADASEAVVNIAVRGTRQLPGSQLLDDPLFRRFFGEPEGERQREFQSAGSGVIVDAGSGYILTNFHVIEEAEDITVTLRDDRVLSAQVIGSDPGTDLALLRIETNDLKAMPLGDSDGLRVGDYVVAIGNPFGLQHTVTSGIVSAMGRVGINPDGYEDFIQTDASINPGNSGGALVNLHGELVGINSAIFAQRGGGNIGIGFAIPINMAKGVMEQLLEFGEVRRGLLGVHIMSVNANIAQAYGLDVARGALVTQVAPDSAADRAGIQVDDVILSVNGRRTDGAGELRNAIGMLRIGEEVELELIRDGERHRVTAELRAGTEDPVAAAGEPGQEAQIDVVFEGATLVNYDRSRPNYIGEDGVLVTDVADDTLAARRDLQAGDIVLSVNRTRVRSVEEFQQAAEGASAVILRVRRGNQNLLVPIR